MEHHNGVRRLYLNGEPLLSYVFDWLPTYILRSLFFSHTKENNVAIMTNPDSTYTIACPTVNVCKSQEYVLPILDVYFQCWMLMCLAQLLRKSACQRNFAAV